MKKVILLMIFSLSVFSQTSHGLDSGEQENTNLLQFRVCEFILLQPDNVGYSAYLAWTPTILNGSVFGIRGNLGVTYLRNEDSQSFPVYDYQGLLIIRPMNHWSIEGGLGKQTWIDPAGRDSAMIYTVGTSIHLTSPFIKLFDRLFADYSYFKTVSTHTNELMVGLGFSF